MTAPDRQQWIVCFCEPGENHPERQFAQGHDDSGRPCGPLWRDKRADAMTDLAHTPGGLVGGAHIVVRHYLHVDIPDEWDREVDALADRLGGAA